MSRLARYSLLLSAILVMAGYFPQLLDLAFGQGVLKTQLFYSPVIQKFVWRDRLLSPEENGVEDAHHALFVQMDQDGSRYDRREFEKLLPFIYYKNMELWGLLPLIIKGRSFDL